MEALPGSLQAVERTQARDRRGGAGLPLSSIEFDALSRLSRAAVVRFSESLDGRISRLRPKSPQHGESPR